MKSLLALVMTAAVASVAGAETNFLVNTSFCGDGIGGALNWKIWKSASGSIRRIPGAGYQGSDALELKFFGEKNFFAQPELHFTPGERYRFGVWVRTKGLEKDHDFRLFSWNYAWEKEIRSKEFPADTGGKWVNVEWAGELIESRTGSYSYAIWGATKNPDAKVEISAPYFEPLTEKARAGGVSVDPATPMVARIVPVDPLLAKVDSSAGRLKFYYPGELDGNATDYVLAVTVDGKPAADAAFGEDHYATAMLGKRGLGRHQVEVKVKEKKSGHILASNDYAIRVVDPVEKGPAGKKLNNFVTELIKVEAADGDYRFFNPREGWVHIGFDRVIPEAVVTLDDMAFPIVRHRPGEGTESMRHLPPGWHVLHVSGVGESKATFAARAVKRIVYLAPDFDPRPSDFNDWKYRFDFCKLYTFPFFNVASAYSLRCDGWPNDARNAYVKERGLKMETLVGCPLDETRSGDPKAWLERWNGNAAFRAGMDAEIDELALSDSRERRIGFAEATWPFADSLQTMNAFFCDPYQDVFNDRPTQTTLLSSIVNSGLGNGMIMPEVYSAAIADEKKAYAWEDHMLRFVASAKVFVPDAEEKILWYFGLFLSPGSWNDWPCPEADIRVLYAHFIHRLATDPEFEHAIGGISAGFFEHVDEDVVRWVCKIMRYYCVDGGTEYLPEKYGFNYLPGFLKDGDFTEGFKHWTAKPAEAGSLVAARREGYGTGEQHRMKVPKGTGDTLARFARSARAPNVLSQKISGLETGRLYALMFLTADEDDVNRPASVPPAFGCRATFDGGVEIPELAVAKNVPSNRNAQGKLWNGQSVSLKTVHRVVFRAEKPEVTLSFTDWQSDSGSGAPAGRRTFLNYIHMRKYYLESGQEFDWLVSRKRKLAEIR